MNKLALSKDLKSQVKKTKKMFGQLSAMESLTIKGRLEMGRHLSELKDIAKHGEWIPFLESCNIHERKARRYMSYDKDPQKFLESQPKDAVEEYLKTDKKSDLETEKEPKEKKIPQPIAIESLDELDKIPKKLLIAALKNIYRSSEQAEKDGNVLPSETIKNIIINTVND